MKRSIWIHSALLLLLLGASWKASERDEIKASSNGVVILDLDHEELRGLVFKSEKQSLKLDIEAIDAERRYAWSTLTTRKEVTRLVPTEEAQLESFPGSGEAAKVEVETVVEEVTHVFKAGKSLEDLLAKLTPFSAKRLIAQTPDKAQLEKWGLVDDTQSVILRTATASGEHEYLLGGKAYRTRDRYVLDTEDQSVYLVDSRTFGVLSRSHRSLSDKSLLGAKESAIEEIRVEGDDKAIVLSHKNRADRRAHKWVLSSGNGNPDSLADWTKKLIRLLAKDYVQPEDVPTGLEAVLRLSASTDQGDITMTLSKGTDPAGDIRWYAQSSHTRELVILDGEQASSLASDFEALVD
jgi:hypothetical protein